MNKQISHTLVLYQDYKLYGNLLRTYPIFVDTLWLYVLQVEERTTSVWRLWLVGELQSCWNS